MHPNWADTVPESDSWRAPRGRSLKEAAREQDEAAGGRSRRIIALPEGHAATASVELKLLPKGRRIYAYLRYNRDGRTVNVYVGQTAGESRVQRLRHAWQQVHARDLLRDDS